MALAELYPTPIYIDQFFRLAWQIVPDPDEYEFIRAPKLQAESYLEQGYLLGDCDDASTMAACMLAALGLPCVITAIRRTGEDAFSHVFTSAPDGPYLVHIDPIVPVHRMPIVDIAETMQVTVI